MEKERVKYKDCDCKKDGQTVYIINSNPKNLVMCGVCEGIIDCDV